MSVRMAELAMAVLMLLASVGVMVKSAELNITWIPGRGPGAGAWPFWLAAGMAACCVATIIRWLLRVTPESRSGDPYIPRETIFLVGMTAFSVFALILMMEFIGTYFAIMVFLAGYLRVIGQHSWKVITIFVLAVPTGVYLLFEVALTKYLPKGLPFFENLFLAVDDLRYEIQFSGQAWEIMGLIAAWVGLSVAIGIYAERQGRNGLLAFFVAMALSPPVGGAIYYATRPRAAAGG